MLARFSQRFRSSLAVLLTLVATTFLVAPSCATATPAFAAQPAFTASPGGPPTAPASTIALLAPIDFEAFALESLVPDARATRLDVAAVRAETLQSLTPSQELLMVRAKFKVASITRTEGVSYPHRKPDGSIDYARHERVELNTIELNPVSANNDPEHENSKFWSATPAGSIKLDVVPAESVAQFTLGAEMYVDFTPVE